MVGPAEIKIHKVEITVSSNKGPSVIAREVMQELTRMSRYRTAYRDSARAPTEPAGWPQVPPVVVSTIEQAQIETQPEGPTLLRGLAWTMLVMGTALLIAVALHQ